MSKGVAKIAHDILVIYGIENPQSTKILVKNTVYGRVAILYWLFIFFGYVEEIN